MLILNKLGLSGGSVVKYALQNSKFRNSILGVGSGEIEMAIT